MSNIKIDKCMGNYDIDNDENMGDSDKESSSTISTDLAMHLSDSSGIETDDIKSDPTFRCKVKKSVQSTIKEGLRSGNSNAKLLNLFDLDSRNNQSKCTIIRSNSTISLEVSVEHHSDIYNDPIYKNPYNSGGYQSSTEISVETIVDPLPPKIIINLLPSKDDQTFVAIYDEETLIGGGEF